MRVSRRVAAFLLGVAAWNVVTWVTFIRNLSADTGRPTGFYVAHSVLIVVNLLIAAGLGAIGWRAWRAAGSGATGADAGASDAADALDASDRRGAAAGAQASRRPGDVA